MGSRRAITTSPAAELVGAAAYRAKIDHVATESAAKAELQKVTEAPTREVPKPKKTDPTPAPRKRAPTGNPHPASVVALPGAKGRESQEVLGGWGWGTDSHPAIKEYEGTDDEPPTSSNKKTLIYMFGGLLGVVGDHRDARVRVRWFEGQAEGAGRGDVGRKRQWLCDGDRVWLGRRVRHRRLAIRPVARRSRSGRRIRLGLS